MASVLNDCSSSPQNKQWFPAKRFFHKLVLIDDLFDLFDRALSSVKDISLILKTSCYGLIIYLKK